MSPTCQSKNTIPICWHEYFVRYELFFPIFGQVQMDRQTESNAYEPTMQSAQEGSKIEKEKFIYMYN